MTRKMANTLLMLLGLGWFVTLGLPPVLGQAPAKQMVKRCVDCKCLWKDANGNKSATPVPRLIKPGADPANKYNYVYDIMDDPNSPCKKEGQRCECRPVIRFFHKGKLYAESADDVAGAGDQFHPALKLGWVENFPKTHKPYTIEIEPVCVLMEKDEEATEQARKKDKDFQGTIWKPQYGQMHE